MQTTPSEEIRLILPGSVALIRLPAGWSQASQKTGAVTIIGPEGDLRVAFVVCVLDGTPEEIARRAWRVFDPGFDFPARQKIPMPGSGGWDAIFQIVYNVPAAESRSAVLVRRGESAQKGSVLVPAADLGRGFRDGRNCCRV